MLDATLTRLGERILETLRELCSTAAPAGYERRVNQWLASRWKDRADEVWMTPVGNLIAHVKGSGPSLMLVAHADEVSFVVRTIADSGFLWITMPTRNFRDRPTLRGPHSFPLGHEALVIGRDGDRPGVFASTLGHLAAIPQDADTRITWDDVFVDVWAESASQIQEWGIGIGAPVVWDTPVRRHGDFVTGKAMDDRVGLAVIDAVLADLDRNALRFDLYVASTVQEEQGLIGAASVNRELRCEYAIILDVGLAGDIPTVNQRDVAVRLGRGPVIVHRDLYTYDVPLTQAVREAANTNGIPVQDAVFSVYASDGGELIKSGAASALVAVPTRYTHSPIETIHLADAVNSVRLLHTFLTTKPAGKF